MATVSLLPALPSPARGRSPSPSYARSPPPPARQRSPPPARSLSPPPPAPAPSPLPPRTYYASPVPSSTAVSLSPLALPPAGLPSARDGGAGDCLNLTGVRPFTAPPVSDSTAASVAAATAAATAAAYRPYSAPLTQMELACLAQQQMQQQQQAQAGAGQNPMWYLGGAPWASASAPSLYGAATAPLYSPVAAPYLASQSMPCLSAFTDQQLAEAVVQRGLFKCTCTKRNGLQDDCRHLCCASPFCVYRAQAGDAPPQLPLQPQGAWLPQQQQQQVYAAQGQEEHRPCTARLVYDQDTSAKMLINFNAEYQQHLNNIYASLEQLNKCLADINKQASEASFHMGQHSFQPQSALTAPMSPMQMTPMQMNPQLPMMAIGEYTQGLGNYANSIGNLQNQLGLLNSTVYNPNNPANAASVETTTHYPDPNAYGAPCWPVRLAGGSDFAESAAGGAGGAGDAGRFPQMWHSHSYPQGVQKAVAAAAAWPEAQAAWQAASNALLNTQQLATAATAAQASPPTAGVKRAEDGGVAACLGGATAAGGEMVRLFAPPKSCNGL